LGPAAGLREDHPGPPPVAG